jgi:hypothetical protein
MRKKIYFTITSLVVIIAALAFTSAASQTSTREVPKRSPKVRKRAPKKVVSYVCPMHPDMRSKSRGECAKCGMDLVERRSS